ncbi:galactose-3-O-sulfotransferase 2 [Nothobranchius furzeri]|uniref:Galactose-3-O-sulfotransferase 2 n=1 Tax=Nothobranchius furzeri TaxID=105023 RepID=A0A8C6PVI9_NOTFU
MRKHHSSSLTVTVTLPEEGTQLDCWESVFPGNLVILKNRAAPQSVSRMNRGERVYTQNHPTGRLQRSGRQTNQFLKRWFNSRYHLLWVLLLLLVVCFTIQMFGTQSPWGAKLTGLLLLRTSISKQNLLPTVPADLEHNQKPRSEQTTNLHRESEEDEESSHDPLLKCVQKVINVVAGSGKMLISTSTKVLNSHRNKSHSKETCVPKSHIVFLKTHKTASSSILNILYRYGESRNLTFALPRNKHSQMFYPTFFASRFVEGFNSRCGRDFHIMCNHMRFRKSEVSKVMLQETFYFSILRHPVAMMESIFAYYNTIAAFSKTRRLEDFLDSCWEDYKSSVRNNHYAHNVLAFDFGFDNNVADGAEHLNERAAEAVAAIERDFHLVLISDYFDESMILLKHALCWSLEDVVSFRLNSRSEQTRHKVSAETAEKIKRWNALDWRIYLHFNATFWHQVGSLVGQEQMKREVSQLRELRAKLANTCLKDGGPVNPSKIKDPGLKPFQYGAAVIQGYNLNPHLDRDTRTKCLRLITPELQYTRLLYTKQFPDLAAKHTPKAQ